MVHEIFLAPGAECGTSEKYTCVALEEPMKKGDAGN
jgi:hypothetical protein